MATIYFLSQNVSPFQQGAANLEMELDYNIFHHRSTYLSSCRLDTTGLRGRIISGNHHLPAYMSKQIPVTYRAGNHTQSHTGWRRLHLPFGLLPEGMGGFFLPYTQGSIFIRSSPNSMSSSVNTSQSNRCDAEFTQEDYTVIDIVCSKAANIA